MLIVLESRGDVILRGQMLEFLIFGLGFEYGMLYCSVKSTRLRDCRKVGCHCSELQRHQRHRVDVLSIFTDVHNHTLYEHLIQHRIPPSILSLLHVRFPTPNLNRLSSSPNVQIQHLMGYKGVRL